MANIKFYLVIALLSGINMPSYGQAISAALSPAATDLSRPATAQGHKTPADDYVIGPDDILSINVWKEPDLCRTGPVRPDGKITVPLIGDVQASGKTPEKLQREIQDQLAGYIAVPAVTVIVQEVKSLKFNIVGEVVKPGSYPLTDATTVLDAIAEAGGLGQFAKSNNIYVLRLKPDGSSLQLPFHYKQVLKGTNLSQNVQLQSHDTIVVP